MRIERQEGDVISTKVFKVIYPVIVKPLVLITIINQSLIIE